MKRPGRKTLIVLLSLLILLVALRIALPYIVLHYSNKKLAHLDGYYGHINDIDIALYRGAYVIEDIYLHKLSDDRKDTSDFFSDPKIDLSVEWRALWQGKIVGEVEFIKPDLRYVMNKTIGKKADKDTTNLIRLIKDFMPLKINRFAVNDGTIHYIDRGRSPKVDIKMTNTFIEGLGLTNKPVLTVLPASITMRSSLYDGSFKADVKLDPLTKIPTFDLNSSLSKTNLVHLNPFFQAYGNFDLKRGTMEMYSEFAARDGKFKGYVKPLIKDLDIVQFEKEEGNILQIAWEAFVGTVAEIFQNQRTEQLATKVPVEGKFSSPDVDAFDAIIAILKNAFIEALKPSLDQSINISNVTAKEEKKGFFKKLFGKSDKEKDTKEEKKKK